MTGETRKDILLAESNVHDADQVVRAMRDRPFGVRHVRTGGEAAAAAGSAVLALIDQRLPDMPGLEVCRAFRARGLDIPVVLLASAPDDDLAGRAMAAGATDFLVKSIAMPKLGPFLDRWLVLA